MLNKEQVELLDTAGLIMNKIFFEMANLMVRKDEDVMNSVLKISLAFQECLASLRVVAEIESNKPTKGE